MDAQPVRCNRLARAPCAAKILVPPQVALILLPAERPPFCLFYIGAA